MHVIDKTDWEILNATADDWENLEQLYRLMSFEESADNGGLQGAQADFLRTVKGAATLEDIANHVRGLVETGLLEARLEPSHRSAADVNDLSFVWRGWFTMTPQGRSVWTASEHTALVKG
jgi:hypothetical protein